MKIQTKGAENTIRMLEKISKDTDGIMKAGLYEGANVVANQYKANLWKIPLEKSHDGLPRIVKEGGKKLKGVTREQRDDLIKAMGISKMDSMMGNYDVSIGVDGYGSIPTRKYPNGVPNAMLLRSIESGTSFRDKTPVVRPAKNSSQRRAVSAIEVKIKKLIEKEK